MLAQNDALLRLLEDDDPATLALIKDQLARRGRAVLPELQALLAVAEPPAARHLREVVAGIEAVEAEAIFGDFCGQFGRDGDLEEAAWRLAAVFLPGENFARQRNILDSWGKEVLRRLRKASTPIDRIETLVEFLGHDVGLRGNDEDYYNLNNSLLPEVIDTHLGLPITLSLVYILVGQRAGISISGTGLPGHFLIRHRHDFFDPFHGGRRVGLDECRERMEQLNMTLTAAHLNPVAPPQFLIRMLANIRSVVVESDPPFAAKVGEWIEALRTSAAMME
jgi:hypothetical protein